MVQNIDNFGVILSTLNETLIEISKKQNILRNVIREKNWEALLEVVKEINRISNYFQDVDEVRNEMQKKMTAKQLEPYSNRLQEIRTKLMRCKAENTAISENVKVTKKFIQRIIDEALPQERNRNYLRNGSITNSKTQSVLVDIRG